MEEGEREDEEQTGEGRGGRISGFAASLAANLVKETISESRGLEGEESDWSIPCSSDCHSHSNLHRGAPDMDSAPVPGNGQLCWTPESSGSLEAGGVQLGQAGPQGTCRGQSGETSRTPSPGLSSICQKGGSPTPALPSSQTGGECLRKVMSVPQVDRVGEGEDTVSMSGSENCKQTGRASFLRHFGRSKGGEGSVRSRGESVGGSSELNGKKRGMRSQLRKTLSSLFHLRGSREEARGEEAGNSPKGERLGSTSSLFRLPSRKPRVVPPCQRALPPVPGLTYSPPSPTSTSQEGGEGGSASPQAGSAPDSPSVAADNNIDFAASIEKVKDHGWYWGPLSGEAAERILAPEPDGSFVVRDSSDHHYIFSLTFKLNGFVRHVRIEHDQGNFSFGSFTKFKSTTIVDFIENAVEHSRSGRYLFFLHRRPVLGPMRVQLLHPVSRFKRVQSLQHLCRYIIVKHVRKDHLDQLPVPNRIKTYLNTPFYYSEQVTEDSESEEAGLEQINDTLSNWGVNQSEDVGAETATETVPGGSSSEVVDGSESEINDTTAEVSADSRTTTTPPVSNQ